MPGFVEELPRCDGAGPHRPGRPGRPRGRQASHGVYSYERAASELAPDELALFQANAAAWAFYQALPPGYRKLTTHRILAARTADTRAQRTALLIDACAQGRRLAAATQMELL